MRRDAQLHREIISRLLDEQPPLDVPTICRRSKLSLRAVQAIAKYLHRKLPRRRRTVRNAPLADLARVRKLVDRLGVASTATKLGVSRQAIYQRLRRASPPA